MDMEQDMFFKEMQYNILGVGGYIGKYLSESYFYCT